MDRAVPPFPPDPHDFATGPAGARAAGRLFMLLLLAGLSAAFAGMVCLYAYFRAFSSSWPSDPPGLPRGVWLSTAVLLLSSLTMAAASRAMQRSELFAARRWLVATLGLALAFLLIQALNWLVMWRGGMGQAGPYALMFYLVTGLHGLHVIGALPALAIVTRRAWAGRYTAARHRGLAMCAVYWHFVDAVWLVLLVLLWLGPRVPINLPQWLTDGP